MTVMMGAAAFGSAWVTMTRLRGAPLRKAISIYGVDMTDSTELRVMRNMCAATKSVRVIAGKVV